ncbi:MAG: hypothetical protein ACRDTT_07075 [Pseudonocardiaceae bacterium]
MVEQIFDRAIPDWRTSVPERNFGFDRWDRHVEVAQRVKALMLRAAEIREKLGDNAPQLDASRLHPWIWEGARSLWRSGHYRDAIGAAAIKLNSEA